MPLAGLALSLLFSWIHGPFVVLLGILLGGSVVVGLMLAFVALASSMTRWCVARLAICGLLLNALLALPF
jgi:hypothetical protein